jgi:hypothetical protein
MGLRAHHLGHGSPYTSGMCMYFSGDNASTTNRPCSDAKST